MSESPFLDRPLSELEAWLQKKLMISGVTGEAPKVYFRYYRGNMRKIRFSGGKVTVSAPGLRAEPDDDLHEHAAAAFERLETLAQEGGSAKLRIELVIAGDNNAFDAWDCYGSSPSVDDEDEDPYEFKGDKGMPASHAYMVRSMFRFAETQCDRMSSIANTAVAQQAAGMKAISEMSYEVGRLHGEGSAAEEIAQAQSQVDMVKTIVDPLERLVELGISAQALKAAGKGGQNLGKQPSPDKPAERIAWNLKVVSAMLVDCNKLAAEHPAEPLSDCGAELVTGLSALETLAPRLDIDLAELFVREAA